MNSGGGLECSAHKDAKGGDRVSKTGAVGSAAEYKVRTMSDALLFGWSLNVGSVYLRPSLGGVSESRSRSNTRTGPKQV